jgi:hypothetical protein
MLSGLLGVINFRDVDDEDSTDHRLPPFRNLAHNERWSGLPPAPVLTFQAIMV